MKTHLLRPAVLFIVGLVAVPIYLQAAISPQSPADERKSFRLADPELEVELVAAEPDVVSPVAIAWDAAGRLYIAEMRDYPNATNRGTIRMLQDRDHDGRYETSTVFADDLRFPNSVLPWNDGVLVTAAPDLLFLKDTDGNGRADERRVIFTGFGAGNQQLRANGLTWGLDGWVYGANGRSDGNVHRPGETNMHSLRGRDFRFRPATGEFETLAGRSQFGLAMDEWGHRFLSWNTIPIRFEVFADFYLARNPDLPATDVITDLLPPGDAGQVFPLTPPPLVFNNESSSHFNALAGLTIYHGEKLGDAYRGNAFVGETLRNLVHRRVLIPDGASFIAKRGEEKTEFLRSEDPWFHPVNFATGPDGALYVVDFYRRFVEHPDFVPKEMKESMPWRAGSEYGRIWRVVRKDQRFRDDWSSSIPDRTPTRMLVPRLQNGSPWQRATAHRLLVERGDKSIAWSLRTVARNSKFPEARVRSLHVLAALGLLDEDTLRAGLRHPDPRVRESAVSLSESWMNSRPSTLSVLSNLDRLADDPSPRVRLRTALALGFIKNNAQRESLISRMLERNTNHWIRLAALSSSRATSKERFAELLPQSNAKLRQPPRPEAPNPDRVRVVKQYEPALTMPGDRQRGASTFGKLCLSCHYLQGMGQRVGPDLSGISSRPVEALLVDLLDPNRQVAPDYTTYEVSLDDGESITGLLASETLTRVTIRRAGTPDENIPRSRIKALQSTNRSLMPDGMESGLSVQDIADLLSFLRNPDGNLLPKSDQRSP